MANSNTQTIYNYGVDNKTFLDASSVPKEPVSTSYAKPVDNISTLDATPIGEPQYDETGVEPNVPTDNYQINPIENILTDPQQITPSHAPGTVFAVSDQSPNSNNQIANGKDQIANSKVAADDATSSAAVIPAQAGIQPSFARGPAASKDGFSGSRTKSGMTEGGDPGGKSRKGLWIALAILFLLLGAAGFFLKQGYDARLAQLEREQAAQDQAAEAANQTTQDQLDALGVKVTTDSVETEDLTVTGDTNLQGGADIQGDTAVDGNTSVDGNLNVTGDVTANSFQGNTNGSHTGSSSGNFQGSGSGNFSGSFSGDGSNLNNVDAETLDGQDSSFYQNAGNLNAGTLSDQRLNSNVALLNRNNQSFTGTNTFEADTNFNGTITADGDIQTQNLLAGNNLSLQGGSGVIRYAQGGFATSLGFAAPTSDTSILFPALAGGNYEVCLNSGNCVGSGGSAPSGADYLTLSANPSLTNERVFALGANLQATDGGANNAYTVSVVASPSFTNGTFSGNLSAQSILQNGNTVCDDSNNCSYAAASGSVNYIQNGTSPQTANFNISGNGTIGGNVVIGPSFTPFLAGASLRVGGSGTVALAIKNIASGTEFGIQAASSSTLLGTMSNHPLAFFTNGTEQVRILANGNVGIGTTTPAQKLHVGGAGPIYSKISSTNSDSAIILAGGGADNFILGNQTNGTSGVSNFSLYSYGTSTDVFTILRNSGNVGIGTTGPGYKLDVAGDINISGASAYKIGGTDICTSAGCTAASGSGSYIQNGTSLQTANMNISGNGYFGGNVGIGTTSPGASLHVVGAANPSIRVQATGNSAVYLDMVADGAGAVQTRYSSNGSMRWATGVDPAAAYNFVFAAGSTIAANQRVVITTGGNVGIGTTSPGTKLHVADINKATSSTGNLFVSTTDAAGADIGGQLSLGGIWSGAGTPLTFGSIAARKENASSGDAAGYLSLSTANSAGGTNTEKLRITSTGNVGIGTTNPTEKLEVYAATGSVYQKISTGAAGSNASPLEVGFKFNGYNNYQKAKIVATERSADTFSSDLLFFTNNGASATDLAERLRINNIGNVGIGNTGPSYKLDVNGDINTTGAIRLQGNSVMSWGGSGTFVVLGSPSTASGLRLATNGTARITIDNTGNVGIGTAPGYKLDVTGDINISSGSAYKINGVDICTSSGCTAASGSGNYIQNGTGLQTANMNISGNGYFGGNVGIGTVAPSQLLHVETTSGGIARFARSATQYIDITADSGSQSILSTSGTNKTLVVGTADNNNFYLRTNNTNRLAITSAGNIGIGTTTPVTMLSNTSSNITAASSVGVNANSIAWDINGAGYAAAIQNSSTGTSRNGLLVKTAATSTDAHVLSVESGGINRLTVRADGNVGIGTVSPTEKLEMYAATGSVYQKIRTNGVGTTASPLEIGLKFNGFADSLKAKIVATERSSNTAGSDLLFFTNNGGSATDLVERLRIDNVGNVGIGTTGPGYKLDVAGDINISGASAYKIAGTNICTSSGCTAAAGSANYIQNGTGLQTANMNISGNGYFGGNVGIGTTAPGGQLHIDGGSGDGLLIVQGGNADNSKISLRIDDGAERGYITSDAEEDLLIGTNQGDDIHLQTGGTTKLFVTGSNGNVGIGNSSPGFKLDVTGDINISGSSAYKINSVNICTSSGCTAASGSNNYIQNGTGLQTANMNIQSASAGSVGAIVRGAVSQTADLQQWRDSGGNVIANIQANGGIGSAGLLNVTGGARIDGAVRFNTSQLGTAQLSVATSSAAGIGQIIQGAASQTADLLQIQDSSGANLVQVAANGSLNGQLGAFGDVSGSSTQFKITSTNPSRIGLAVKGAASQTGDLQQWQNSGGTVVARVFSNGNFSTINDLYAARLNNAATSNNSSVQMDVNGTFITTGVAGNIGLRIRNINASPTGDLLQAQDSTGVTLAKIDVSGNLTVKDAAVQGNLVVTGNATFNGSFITFSNNVRGFNVPVVSTSSLAVNFASAHADTSYAVLCTPSWNTTCYVTGKTVNGFTLNFGTASGPSDTVDWFAPR